MTNFPDSPHYCQSEAPKFLIFPLTETAARDKESDRRGKKAFISYFFFVVFLLQNLVTAAQPLLLYSIIRSSCPLMIHVQQIKLLQGV